MMYKPLPVVDRLNQMEDSQARDQARRQIVAGLLANEGFQLVLETLRGIEGEALRALQAGTTRPDLEMGRMHAVEQVRESIRYMASQEDIGEDLGLDDDLNYGNYQSGFLEGDVNG